MNYNWILLIGFVIFGIFFLSRFKKTKLFSNFPFEEGEKVIFEEEPASLIHKQFSIINSSSTHKSYTFLRHPIIKITNKKRIIFAQKNKNDAIVYAVFSMTDLTEEQKSSWIKLGFTFATLSAKDISVTTNTKKAHYELILTGGMLDPISGVVGSNDFLMQVYTNDISSYEKNLDVKINLQ